MRITLRVLSALLRYPDREVQEAAGEFASALASEAVLTSDQIQTLLPLIDDVARADLLDIQERYVGLFDRGRALSLHLFEHVHGESRDRGQAMVDLRERYEAEGLEIAASELPDFLPLFLEYLSVLPPHLAREQLGQPGLILAALAERMEERETPYAAPMRILAELSGSEGGEAAMAPPDNPDDLVALDAAWEEEQVRFDVPAPPGAAQPCPQAAEIVARFHASEPDRSNDHG